MKALHLVCISACLMLAGCASTTTYAPAETPKDYGYYSTKLGDDRYRISFNGNTSTSQNTVKDYALLRAAELTLQEGGSWFQVVDRGSDKETRSTPARTEVRRTEVIERDCGLLGCETRRRPAYTTTIGVEAGKERSKYSSSLEIVIGSGEMPSGDGHYYDAKELASTLRSAM
ncbi:CC0125/CC1285 family lipoprotein [Kangiella marina]|uniref:Lipoprotein n=1 Tax=Kangiella marina TaxID=1079178 RepID=A0ABP8IMT4_9GAMM